MTRTAARRTTITRKTRTAAWLAAGGATTPGSLRPTDRPGACGRDAAAPSAAHAARWTERPGRGSSAPAAELRRPSSGRLVQVVQQVVLPGCLRWTGQTATATWTAAGPAHQPFYFRSNAPGSAGRECVVRAWRRDKLPPPPRARVQAEVTNLKMGPIRKPFPSSRSPAPDRPPPFHFRFSSPFTRFQLQHFGKGADKALECGA